MAQLISRQIIDRALQMLNDRLDREVTMILGGGACMIMAHDYPLATTDVDALPRDVDFEVLDPHVKDIARELDLPGDWLNPYFSSFTFVLPPDYAERLKDVFVGERLRVRALGREDMLVLKCFAHRPKDLGHARALVKAGADLAKVARIIEAHADRGTPKAGEALEFLDDLIDETEG